MIILAIDPGTTESAYVLIDSADCRPIEALKLPNDQVLRVVRNGLHDVLAVEWIASYGMPVGAEVFDTCRFVGRIEQTSASMVYPPEFRLVKRGDIKIHHCHSAKAKDANVAQALRDRFAPGVRNYGKGTKAEPGWFAGFHRDVWASYALAVYVADTISEAAA